MEPAGGYGSYHLHTSTNQCKHTNRSLRRRWLSGWQPPHPESPELLADSSLAYNMIASFSSNNVSDPQQAVAPRSAVRANKPNIALCRVSLSSGRSASGFLPAGSLSYLFSDVIRLLQGEGCFSFGAQIEFRVSFWKLLMSSFFSWKSVRLPTNCLE